MRIRDINFIAITIILFVSYFFNDLRVLIYGKNYETFKEGIKVNKISTSIIPNDKSFMQNDQLLKINELENNLKENNNKINVILKDNKILETNLKNFKSEIEKNHNENKKEFDEFMKYKEKWYS